MNYELSVIVPIYNEEETIPELFKELEKFKTAFQAQISRNPAVQIVFVNDGSQDTSFSALKEIAEKHSDYLLINLSRNFGHQMAVTAGLQYASGHYCALMDADLQDPPEIIIQLYQKCIQGYDVVYARRRTRASESPFKLFTAKLFYRLLKRITNVNIPVDTGDFRIMSARVVTQLRNMPETHRFIRGMVSWVGFPQTYLEYDRHERFAGTTKYPLSKMIKFALDGITSFSVLPLKIATFLGYMYTVFAIIYTIYILYLKFFTDQLIQGWAGIVVLLCLTGGILFILLGILGEYVGRIYEEVKDRPNYIVENIYSKKTGL